MSCQLLWVKVEGSLMVYAGCEATMKTNFSTEENGKCNTS